MIAIIDYGAGNIFSVKNALEKFDENILLTNDNDEILAADKVILPGVGSFSNAMEKMKKYNLVNTVYDIVEKNIPFLGICLGLQICFEHSEEGGVNGMGIFKGKIKKFPSDSLKVPQIGWNKINITKTSPIFDGITDNFFYFVHSYFLDKGTTEQENIAATTNYALEYASAYSKENVFLTQFHPEKSGKTGLRLLENFANLKRD